MDSASLSTTAHQFNLIQTKLDIWRTANKPKQRTLQQLLPYECKCHASLTALYDINRRLVSYVTHYDGTYEPLEDININTDEEGNRNVDMGTLGRPCINAFDRSPDMFVKSRFFCMSKYAWTTYRSREIRLSDCPSLQLNTYIIEEANIAARGLLLTNKFRVVPDKIILYKVGDHFEPHRDTPVSPDHVATVVFKLGKLSMKKFGLELFLGSDWIDVYNVSSALRHNRHPNSEHKGRAVCFYTDVLHRVPKVTEKERQRLVITFKVFRCEEECINANRSVNHSDNCCNNTEEEQQGDGGEGGLDHGDNGANGGEGVDHGDNSANSGGKKDTEDVEYYRKVIDLVDTEDFIFADGSIQVNDDFEKVAATPPISPSDTALEVVKAQQVHRHHIVHRVVLDIVAHLMQSSKSIGTNSIVILCAGLVPHQAYLKHGLRALHGIDRVLACALLDPGLTDGANLSVKLIPLLGEQSNNDNTSHSFVLPNEALSYSIDGIVVPVRKTEHIVIHQQSEASEELSYVCTGLLVTLVTEAK